MMDERTTDLPLSGMNVLVTGASGGIGAAIVTSLVDEGASAVIHYGRDEKRAAALLERIGGRGWTVGADLSDPAGATTLWDRAVALAGRIHGLVAAMSLRSTTPGTARRAPLFRIVSISFSASGKGRRLMRSIFSATTTSPG
jgi:NAD(P)-dependent dehydrogenase (short-subunit alcohol dehydrogenase family)